MRMAAGIEEAGFWLPSEFLTDDDFIVDKENFSNELDTDFCFPSEFPYHFETHTDNLLQLQKFCAMSTSPQSTLAYLSAGVSSSGSPISAPNLPLSCPSVYPKFGNFGTRAAGGLGQVAWAPHQIRGGGAAAKKVCAGTGVFLPRRYDNISDSNVYSSGPRRKQGCPASSSPFLVRASPQIYTKPSYTSIYRFVESQPEPLPLPMGASNHNSVLAPRHAVVLRQRRSFLTNTTGGSFHDHQCLPREWTY